MQKEIPVEFGGSASVGEATTRISVCISRSHMTLEDADAQLCGKRITGSIRVLPKNADPDQQSFDGMDEEGPSVITGAFDVKSVRVTPDEISAGLTFNKLDLEGADIRRFVKRSGRMKISNAEPLPDDDADDSGDEESPTESRKPNSRQKPLIVVADLGAAMPITSLIEFGITKKKCDIIRTAAGGDTIGHFESFMRSNEWWHRELKGMGEEWITKLQDAHLAFRQRNPMPTEEDAEDLQKARQAGETAADRGIPREDCSYDAGTAEAAAWLDAYDAKLKASA